ncbi:hypothetical protein WM04_06895 [Burkholderia ubonensis]|uniref:hypothetical protein n=1 Tax=Burkholderia ubonensis TaxID=101571 RepID=UPI000752AF77|nr:hypothetical protein [Burkholderia ubonensis]KWI36358.1 hypothetical protein WM04_06895 [Burkholderia ubonensis]OJB15532.1 hypothetical protein BGV53_20115 [Burkholderia ubonensis]
MKGTHLFESSSELQTMLQTLTGRRVDVAHEILHRIEAQRAAAMSLGKFSNSLNIDAYGHARELLPAVAAGFMPVDRLHVLMLQLECDFRGAAARAQRSKSAKRFDAFWSAFETVVRRRTCRTARDAYRTVVESGIPKPHPQLSSAERRFGRLMRCIS